MGESKTSCELDVPEDEPVELTELIRSTSLLAFAERLKAAAVGDLPLGSAMDD